MPLKEFIKKIETLDLKDDGMVNSKLGNFKIGELKPYETNIFIPHISFIDGGQGIMMSTPGNAIAIVKIALVEYNKLEIEKSTIFSCYIIAKADGESFSFDIETIQDQIGMDYKEITHKFKTPIVHDGRQISAEESIGKLRRLLEIKTASAVTKSESLVVLDGHLESESVIEEKMLAELKSKVLISGLTKKTNMLTTTGNSVQTIFGKNEGYFVTKTKEFILAFVRLHPKSQFVFKYEIAEKPGIDFGKIIGTLSAHSKDPIFPGYPYGLIKADQLARVSNQEKEYQRNLLIGKLGNKWEILRNKIDAPDAHKVLDTIY